MPASLYAPILDQFVAAGLNWATDTIKALLTTSVYTPDPVAHQFRSAVTNEVVGTGYTAGGLTLTAKSAVRTAANNWATARANTTNYLVGDIVRPAAGNGFLYQAVTAGASGAAVPAYPTVVGQTVVDGGVTWLCVGRAVLVLDFADLQWASSTITARTIVVYKDTGAAATSPLIAFDTLAADVVSSSGTWQYTVDVVGLVTLFA